MVYDETIIKAKIIDSKTRLLVCDKRFIELWNLRKGEALTVMDDYFEWHRARLLNISDENCLLESFERIKNPEPGFLVRLYQAVPEKERMELIIEKSAELGVMEIIPVVSSRSSTIDKRDEKQKKSHKWPVLALKASKQCRRGSILKICPEKKLEDCLSEVKSDVKLFLNEYERHLKLRDIDFNNIKTVSVFNGPEGGFSDFERSSFMEKGFFSVSLGTRILRTETAAFCVCSYFASLY
ncbi:MAG: 16S rRNA (uracil(1498)-N(3))-methyltransferase [Desulfobacteraceae bacterium]|nr:16S rRNA (uracil(1498)-N(3))-methyltransferase [Desulfobacteraceae bacterium]MCB9494777.1 16S rRNA (uracil(1498)-N(3))-methyltransferase [Desulfobacteraceae bacterium]